MESDDGQIDINADHMLLEVSENHQFSDKTELVKNLLISNKDLFSQKCLHQSLLSCCGKNIQYLLPAIISTGANLEVTDENGNTPLLVCALHNSESCARCLIAAGANVNAVNFDGDTPLMVSVRNKAFIAMTKLLAGSQDIKIDYHNNKGYTALLYAIEAVNFNAIKLLIDASDISGLNEVFYDTVLKDRENRNIILSLINLFKLQKVTGESPFLHAALNKDLESARIMISMDKSIVNAPKDSLASVLITFLESIEENNMAVNQTEVEIERALDDAVQRNLKKALHFLLSEFPNQVGQKLRSPKLLHNAVVNSSFNIIPFLIDHGADINSEYNGKYCLTQVVDCNVLDLLLSRGADPNIKIGSNSYTYPLHTFLSKEFKMELKRKWTFLQPSGVTNSFLNKEIKAFVQCLLKHGAQVDQKDGQGQTALHIAAGKDHTVDLFKILISSGVDVNIVDNQGQSPIHKSVDSKVIGKLNCLVRNNATIDLKDNHGQTALHIAAASKFNSARILEILISSGADVNTTDNGGETPLSNAVVSRNYHNLKILINAGADVNFVRRSTGKPVLFDAGTIFSSSKALCCIGAKGIKRLIDAGCDVTYVDNDVNASRRREVAQFVVTWLLSQVYECPEEIFPCVEYFIDHNANIDDVHFSIMHVLITFGYLSLIPKFVSLGCAPTYKPSVPVRPDYSLQKDISPLMMALLMDQSELAKYFINIKYLMKSDIDVLNGDSDTQIELEDDSLNKSLDLLKTVGQQPLSLETLCSVVISDILGPTQDRRLKIEKLELTQPVKDLLLFKNVGKCHIKNVGKTDRRMFDMSVDYFLDESVENGFFI